MEPTLQLWSCMCQRVSVIGLIIIILGACGDEQDDVAALCDGVRIGEQLRFQVPTDRVEPGEVLAWHAASCGDAECCANVPYSARFRCDAGHFVELRAGSSAALCNGPVGEYPGGDPLPDPAPECRALATCDVAGAIVVGELDADGVFVVDQYE